MKDRSSELAIGPADESKGDLVLDFERPLAELELEIQQLVNSPEADQLEQVWQIRELTYDLAQLTSAIYDSLSPWQVVQVARHPRRPQLCDYLDTMIKDFRELHGERAFGDDRAIITGFGRVGREKAMIVGHNKGGRTMSGKIAANFGCAHPEGYRKAVAKMKLAERYHLPVICLIDTPGAYPGVGAEQRGQPHAIAESMRQMCRLRVPVICIVIGEGGSGGALGLGVGDRVAMMQYAWYAIASPEACAAILWKDRAMAPTAAEALNLTARDLLRLGIVDEIIPEPLRGAHRNPAEAVKHVETYLIKTLRSLQGSDIEPLVENRYQRLRRIGTFVGG